jgi:hypothetical protein
MKKNPLEEIYASKVLVSESVPSNKVKDAKSLESEMDLKKGTTVAGQGPEAAKKGLVAPKEAHGTEVHTPQVLKDSMETEEPKKAFEGSFEKLFKATISENMMDDNAMEMEVTVPTSDEEMADEIEDTTDEVTDLVGDLKEVMGKLQSILDKIGEETAGGEESEMEAEMGGEEAEGEESSEEEPFKEAVELKPLGDKGKALMGKNNKVGGNIKVHGGKADAGDVESDPELKPAKAHDKALQSPKGKPEVKSTVKKGEFFK